MAETPRPSLRQPDDVVVSEVRVRPADQNEHVEVHQQDPTGLERHEEVVRDASGRTEHHEEVLANHAVERQYSIAKASQVVNLIVGIIEGLIAIRIVLKLIAANPENAFAHLMYGLSGIFVDPFLTLTVSPSTGGAVLEIPSLIAMAVYALLGWAIVKIIGILLAPSRARAKTTYDRYRV